MTERAQKAIERKAKQEAKLAESQAKKAAQLAKKAIPKPKAPVQSRAARNVVPNDHKVRGTKKVVASRTIRSRAVIVPRRSL